MKKSVIVIDILALIGFLFSFAPNITGYAIHEWLGLAVGGVIFIHLLQHWQWVLNVTQSLGHVKKKLLIRYLVDFSLFLFFFFIILTGLVISSLMNLPLVNYETWRVLHVVSSYGTLVMVGFKVAIHWDWISKQFRKMTGTKTRKVVQNSGRRAFLRTGAITSLAAVVAVVEYKEWHDRTTVSAESVALPATSTELEELPSATATSVPTQIPTVEEVNDSIEVISEEPTNTLIPTIVPTATIAPTATVVAETGVVRCNKQCSYPGRCGRYQDDNQNGKCDLGEPIW